MLTEKVQARIEPELKRNVEKVFQKLGLSTTDAVRLFFKQVELYNGLPFSLNVPNKATIQAIRDCEEGENISHYKTFDDLLDEVHA